MCMFEMYLFISTAVDAETRIIFPEAAGRFMEPISDGLPTHRLCMFTTSQCKSQLKRLNKSTKTLDALL